MRLPGDKISASAWQSDAGTAINQLKSGADSSPDLIQFADLPDVCTTGEIHKSIQRVKRFLYFGKSSLIGRLGRGFKAALVRASRVLGLPLAHQKAPEMIIGGDVVGISDRYFVKVGDSIGRQALFLQFEGQSVAGERITRVRGDKLLQHLFARLHDELAESKSRRALMKSPFADHES